MNSVKGEKGAGATGVDGLRAVELVNSAYADDLSKDAKFSDKPTMKKVSATGVL